MREKKMSYLKSQLYPHFFVNDTKKKKILVKKSIISSVLCK